MTLRNELTRAMRKAEAEYWWDGLGNKVKGSRDFWKHVKQMTKKKRSDLKELVLSEMSMTH